MEDRRNGQSILRQWGLVACLTVVSMLAQVDKNILVLMVGPIQRDFGASDVQISLLIGAAFAVANIVVGLPAGWLADRVNRRVVIALGRGGLVARRDVQRSRVGVRGAPRGAHRRGWRGSVDSTFVILVDS